MKKLTKNNIINAFKTGFIAIALTVGVNYLYAQSVGTWNEPTAAPTANNTATPINVGIADQTKAGGLIIGHSVLINALDPNSVPYANGLIVANGNVGIGTLTPSALLEVNGQVKIDGGTPGASKVLTSDATGLASWKTAGASGGGVTQIIQGPGIVVNPTSGTGSVTISMAPAWVTLDSSDTTLFDVGCQYRFTSGGATNGAGGSVSSAGEVSYATTVLPNTLTFTVVPSGSAAPRQTPFSIFMSNSSKSTAQGIIYSQSTSGATIATSVTYSVTKVEKNCGPNSSGSGTSKTIILIPNPSTNMPNLQASAGKTWTVYYKYNGVSGCTHASDNSATCGSYGASTVVAGGTNTPFGTMPSGYGGENSIDIRADMTTLGQVCNVLFPSQAPFAMSSPGKQYYNAGGHNYIYWDPALSVWFAVGMSDGDGVAVMQNSTQSCTSTTNPYVSSVTTITAQ